KTRGGRVRRSGKGWSCRCPAHDDRKNSLDVAEGAEGRVLLHCHAGCTYAQILAALGLQEKDGFEGNGDGGDRARKPTNYDYTDEQGNVLSRTVRSYPKAFKQCRPDGRGKWIWNLTGVRRVLFHLPQLITATQAGKKIYVVEGEK